MVKKKENFADSARVSRDWKISSKDLLSSEGTREKEREGIACGESIKGE